MPLTEEQIRVSMADPQALKRWLVESGRKWILMSATDLVDSAPWPEGVEDFKRVIDRYRDYRMTLPTGETEAQTTEEGDPIDVPVMKGEVLTLEEKRALYDQLKVELMSAGVLA